MATENLMMAAVAAGGDRQSPRVVRRPQPGRDRGPEGGGGRNDLLDRLAAEPVFARVDFDSVLNRTSLVGRAPEQVDEFLNEVVEPIRRRYPRLLGQTDSVEV